MATYDIKCTKCGKEVIDYEKSIYDDFPDCPECGGQMRQRYSTFNFLLKGEGWSMQGFEKPNAEMESISIKKER